jgi:SAM-dependent methyltransferase
VDEENDWDREAGNWVRWARTPGHDAYWQYRDAFFDQMVPAPGRRTLEIGCGEGRVARDLEERGHRVVAVDRSVNLLGYAKGANPTGVFVLANGAQLPVADASCDLVIAYNSLMDVADMGVTRWRSTCEPSSRRRYWLRHSVSQFLPRRPITTCHGIASQCSSRFD